MKITSQDEYGLRVLIQIGRSKNKEGISIPQLSEAEGLSVSYISKITRSLRMAGLIKSTRGHKGGYLLSKPATAITISEVMKALGGQLYDDDFCARHTGTLNLCNNSVDCSIRSLWKMVQFTIDRLLEKVTLQELLASEADATCVLQSIVEENAHELLN